MNAMNVLNIVLWSVQGFLALFFLAAGAPKIFGRGIEKWTGFSDLPRSQVVFIGFAEVLGAAGLVLPMATGILPWLTPLAAVGLAIIVLMATGFHVRAGSTCEPTNASTPSRQDSGPASPPRSRSAVGISSALAPTFRRGSWLRS
jgi:uncharacterized membrane protein YphA (DoxX/SURF4 family)